jgi:predicted class III extradiol MEMO1 family dioxygenase
MSDEDFDELVVHSSVFKHYQAKRESIARHQQHIEKTEHCRIDFETALVDWMLKTTRGFAGRASRLTKLAHESHKRPL